MPTLFQR